MINYTFSLLGFEFFLLILVRIAGYVVVAPFIGLQGVPARTKAGFAAIMAVIVYQTMDAPKLLEFGGIFSYSSMVLREALCGMLLGLFANVCTYIIGFAGHLIDLQMGLSMAQEYNPMTRTQESVSGNLYNYIILLILITSGLYQYIVRAIIDSFQLIPVNGVVFEWDNLMGSFLNFMTEILLLGFRINLPMFAVMLTVNSILGIMAKVAPQMNMFAVGMQIKLLIGYTILFFTIIIIPGAASMIGEEIKLMLKAAIGGMDG